MSDQLPMRFHKVRGYTQAGSAAREAPRLPQGPPIHGCPLVTSPRLLSWRRSWVNHYFHSLAFTTSLMSACALGTTAALAQSTHPSPQPQLIVAREKGQLAGPLVPTALVACSPAGYCTRLLYQWFMVGLLQEGRNLSLIQASGTGPPSHTSGQHPSKEQSGVQAGHADSGAGGATLLGLSSEQVLGLPVTRFPHP